MTTFLKHRGLLRTQALSCPRETGGLPLPDSTLRASLRLSFAHLSLLETDLDSLLRELEADRLITGTDHPVSGLRHWSLTLAGQAASQY